MTDDVVARYGADPIPIWVLPHGRCWRDPRHPQGIAAVKLKSLRIDHLVARTIWAAKWLVRRGAFGRLLRQRVWRWHKMTTVMFSIGQTNIQKASSGLAVGFWIHRLVIWLLTTNPVFSIRQNIKVKQLLKSRLKVQVWRIGFARNSSNVNDNLSKNVWRNNNFRVHL